MPTIGDLAIHIWNMEIGTFLEYMGLLTIAYFIIMLIGHWVIDKAAWFYVKTERKIRK